MKPKITLEDGTNSLAYWLAEKKMTLLPKVINRSNTILIKTPITLSTILC